jgi:hypothetical protein
MESDIYSFIRVSIKAGERDDAIECFGWENDEQSVV